MMSPFALRRGVSCAAVMALLILGTASIAGAQALVNEQKLIPDVPPFPFSGEGSSVAISGTTVVVGAPYGSDGNEFGSAHVFVLNGSTWTSQATLTPGDPSPFDGFGTSVAISGNTILVAAPYTDQTAQGHGAVYVYERSGAEWNPAIKWTQNFGDLAYFGTSVAIEDDTAVVGDSANSDPGRLVVFQRSGGVWSPFAAAWLSPGNPHDGSQFGNSTAIKGDIIVTGAPNDTVFGAHIGTVSIFKRVNGLWASFGELITNELSDGDGFGVSVAVENELIIVGAPHQNSGAGAAYVFHQQANGEWTSLPQFWTKLLPKSPQTDDSFGFSVSINAGIVLAGAPGRVGGKGAVIGYNDLTGTSTGTSNSAINGVAGDVFGWSVAIDAKRAVVGAPIEQPGGQGYAYDVQKPISFPRFNWTFILWPYKYIYMGCPIELQADTAATIKMDLGRHHLTPSIATAPRNGALRFVSANTIEYRPDRGFSGHDAFTVRLTDRAGVTLDKTADVTVIPLVRGR